MRQRNSNRPPMTRGEWLLLGLPAIVIVLILAGLVVRKATIRPAIEVSGSITDAQLSADGKLVLVRYVTQPGTAPGPASRLLAGWKVETLEKSWERPDTAPLARLSPSGTQLLSGWRGRVSVQDAASGTIKVNLPRPAGDWPVWTNDERWLQGRINVPVLLNSTNGSIVAPLSLRRWFRGPLDLGAFRISGDGKKAAIRESQGPRSTRTPGSPVNQSHTGRIAVVSWPDGRKLAEAPGDLYGDCVWSADNRHLVALTGVSEGFRRFQVSIAKLDTVTGKTQWTHLPGLASNGTRWEGEHARLSPGGRFVGIPYSGNGFAVYETETATLKLDIGPSKSGGVTGMVPPAFGPDGQFVMRAAGNRIEFFDLAKN